MRNRVYHKRPPNNGADGLNGPNIVVSRAVERTGFVFYIDVVGIIRDLCHGFWA